MKPWLLVAGDFTPLGGMDAANHALARHLADLGEEVHVVTHRAWADLRSMPSLTVHDVWRPFGRHLLGSPMLARAGRRLWQRLMPRGVRAVVNGGNCPLGDANWVHYMHAAYPMTVAGSAGRRTKAWVTHQRDLRAERMALESARLVICNSQRTARDVVNHTQVDADRVAVVYYGSDPIRFGPISDDERSRARLMLGVRDERPLVGFVGALGDRRKAFDTLFAAWGALCKRPDWDATLIVVGAGAEQAAWQARAADAGLRNRMAFLGFRSDVADVLAALDALAHPARYEAYGLSVHEAICRGLPALVTRSAGVAERYPDTLSDLVIDDPDDARELGDRLWRWRSTVEGYRSKVAPLATRLRARSWHTMSGEIIECVERAAA